MSNEILDKKEPKTNKYLEKLKQKSASQSNKNLTQVLGNDDVLELDISTIEPNPFQPRKYFDEESLQELAASIEKHGLLQPISVTQRDNRYILIAGERRFRAHKINNKLKIKSIIIQDVSDEDLEKLALIENVIRKDITIMEEAFAYKRMQDKGMSIREIAIETSIGKTRIGDLIQLLKFDETNIDFIVNNSISQTRSLLKILKCPTDLHEKLLKKLANNNLTIEQIDKIIELSKSGKKINIDKIVFDYPYNLPAIEGVNMKQKNNKLNIIIDLNKFMEQDSDTIKKYIQNIFNKSKPS